MVCSELNLDALRRFTAIILPEPVNLTIRTNLGSFNEEHELMDVLYKCSLGQKERLDIDVMTQIFLRSGEDPFIGILRTRKTTAISFPISLDAIFFKIERSILTLTYRILYL
jgi:hypothetical protein